MGSGIRKFGSLMNTVKLNLITCFAIEASIVKLYEPGCIPIIDKTPVSETLSLNNVASAPVTCTFTSNTGQAG